MTTLKLIICIYSKFINKHNYYKNIIKKLLLPYLIFQLIYTGYYYLLGKSNFQNDLFDPQWSLWFLLSLFFWHLLLILFKKIPAFLSISIAIIRSEERRVGKYCRSWIV